MTTPTQDIIVGWLSACDGDVDSVGDRLRRGEWMPLNAGASEEVARAEELLGQARDCLTAARHRTLGV